MSWRGRGQARVRARGAWRARLERCAEVLERGVRVEEVPRERDAVFAVLEAKQSDGHGCCAGRSWGVRVSTVSLKGNYTKWKQTYENISHRSPVECA